MSEARTVARSRAIAVALGALALAAPAGAAAQGGTPAPPPGPAEPPSSTGGAGYGRVPLPDRRKRAKRRKHGHAKRGHARRGRIRRPRRRRLGVLYHRFPLAGPFSYGGADARFGARRPGHRHQGQDLTAPAGTPVVAPRRGVVEAVRYQARGAGRYVVLDGEGEDRDYVFMHLGRRSVPVRPGERVRTGQRIGEVGSTGTSTGPHLHFEVWVGGWVNGRPVDPLPLLRRWN
jgi:murein DD-endopeptidase MepM/ murein hydrolase activator NlpD